MNLGDVTEKSVPKMTLVAPPRHGGAVTTRVFIPHQAHSSIGVLGAVTAATARSEEHTSELQSLMRISYAVFCLKKKKQHQENKQARNLINMLQLDKLISNKC